MWSSEPNMFTNAVAQNARRQRKYVWSIAQLQLLKLPSPSILTKGLYMNLISWWGLLSKKNMAEDLTCNSSVKTYYFSDRRAVI